MTEIGLKVLRCPHCGGWFQNFPVVYRQKGYCSMQCWRHCDPDGYKAFEAGAGD